MQRLTQRLAEFFFPPASDLWLTILRVGLGLQVTLFCISSGHDWQLLFAGHGGGLISRDLAEAILSAESTLVPRLGWVVAAGGQLGLGEDVILKLAWLVLFSAGIGLLVGIFCRASAISAWLLFLCAAKSGALMSYGMDNFTTIGLFYLMVAPLPDRYSFDAKIRKVAGKERTRQGFHRRVLQLHLCVIYFFGGLTKVLAPAWWNGESVWRALTRSPFNIIPPAYIASWGALLPLMGIGVCLLETSYPIFIWSRRTRAIWLGSILAMHLGIGFAMGLYLFALIMIVLNLAAFGPGLQPPFARKKALQPAAVNLLDAPPQKLNYQLRPTVFREPHVD